MQRKGFSGYETLLTEHWQSPTLHFLLSACHHLSSAIKRGFASPLNKEPNMTAQLMVLTLAGWWTAPNLAVDSLLLISCSKELCVPQAESYWKRTSLPLTLTAVMQLFTAWIEHRGGGREVEKEEEDLKQVAALVSCSAAVQSYIIQLEWREEKRRWELKFIK